MRLDQWPEDRMMITSKIFRLVGCGSPRPSMGAREKKTNDRILWQITVNSFIPERRVGDSIYIHPCHCEERPKVNSTWSHVVRWWWQALDCGTIGILQWTTSIKQELSQRLGGVYNMVPVCPSYRREWRVSKQGTRAQKKEIANASP